MAIRKFGAARDQEVTGIEQDGITREAAKVDWDERDDQELAAENRADTAARVPLDDA